MIDEKLHDEIAAEIIDKDLPNLAAVQSLHIKIRSADANGEIGRINRIFYFSLQPKFKTSFHVTNSRLKLLDKANVYTWLAYSIYDDVLDESATDLLNSANILLRMSFLAYLRAGIPADFIHQHFSIVDSANAREIELRNNPSMQLDDYETLLSHKSIAHCLGQIWILNQLKVNNAARVTYGFYEYCGARQLNDDIFDWRDDVKTGQITYATATLFKFASIKPGSQVQSKDMQSLNIAFWQDGLERLCEHTQNLAADSASNLRLILKNDSLYISNFIHPIGNSAHKSAQVHRAKKVEFERRMKHSTAP